jgi:Peptidase family M28
MKPTPLLKSSPRAFALLMAFAASCSQLSAQTPAKPASQTSPSQTPAATQVQPYQARIAATLPADKAVAPLIYLASDRLKGRYIGRPEIDTAAQYIADQFQAAGARPIPGADGYFQHFTLSFMRHSPTGSVTVGSRSFNIGADALQFDPGNVQLNASVIYIGDDSTGQLDALDLKGKLVLMDAGAGTRQSAHKDLGKARQIRQILTGKQALGLLVSLNADSAYWSTLQSGLSGEHRVLADKTPDIPMIALRYHSGDQPLLAKGATGTASVTITATPTRELKLKNVLAFVQGTDPALRDQYIVLSAHYDHLGVAAQPKMEEGKLDSIYNGARDNALGSTAVIDAAKYFGRYPPKRSIMFVTYSAEEEGLLGSEYYAGHPIVPLNHTVYNLNIDNASYNDTTLISLVGLNRTSEDANIISACKAYGLSVNGDPTGGQLFFESDNAPLALKGIPAPTYSLGMRTFDSTIFNRYHRLSDETGNMNMRYAVKFIRAYILSAIYIANDATQPMWTKGDPYEATWKTLFKAGN